MFAAVDALRSMWFLRVQKLLPRPFLVLLNAVRAPAITHSRRLNVSAPGAPRCADY